MFFDYCDNYCEYGHGICTIPDTSCIHWQGTFCELDINENETGNKTENKKEE